MLVLVLGLALRLALALVLVLALALVLLRCWARGQGLGARLVCAPAQLPPDVLSEPVKKEDARMN